MEMEHLDTHTGTISIRSKIREKQSSINKIQEQGVICVEMEVAELYAFATTKNKKIVCLRILTSTMAQSEVYVEKGEHFRSLRMLELIWQVIKNTRYGRELLAVF
jgi:purine-nucleoside phosphorylase